MRCLSCLIFALSCLLGYAATARADADVNVDGEIRFRTELDDRTFREGTDMSAYNLLRTRLGVGAFLEDNALFYAQFQDSRTLGGLGAGGFQSGTLNDGRNVDVHQAYLKIAKLWREGLGVKLGRFEVALGNERVFGPVGWSNVGRSWEGATAWYRTEALKLTGMALKRRELQGPFHPSEDTDFDVYGVVADLADPAFQLFCVYEYDSSRELALAAGGRDGANDLDRVTLGIFFKNQVEGYRLDYSLNAAYQTGTAYDSTGTGSPVRKLDIGAYMLTFEVGYTIGGSRPARIAAAIDYTSGDGDPADGDWRAYNNLYYTGHKWRGFMDYFLDSSPSGLVDLKGHAGVELAPKWWLSGDLHWFRTAAEYDDPLGGGGARTTDVGTEIDLTLKTESIDGVGMLGGASFFMPKDAFADTFDPGSGGDPRTGLWFYYQFIVSFD